VHNLIKRDRLKDVLDLLVQNIGNRFNFFIFIAQTPLSRVPISKHPFRSKRVICQLTRSHWILNCLYTGWLDECQAHVAYRECTRCKTKKV